MLVDYVFAKEEMSELPDGLMYRYVVGANGVFVQAKREGLEACLWSSALVEPIRGLAEVQPYVRLASGQVDWLLMANLFNAARREAPNEALFYISDQLYDGEWLYAMPLQEQSPSACAPLDPFSEEQRNSLIEVHSHHSMGAFFSRMDDKEEQGFKIYAVMGQIFERPTLLVRVGIYGHFWQIPASWVFALPFGVRDGLEVELEVLHDYGICAGE